MKKQPYSSPDVMYLELMTGAILVESNDSNTIPPLDFYEMIEE